MGKVLRADFLAPLILLLFSTGPALGQVAGARTLTNQEITGMVKAGLSSGSIITAIRTSRCDFDTDPLVLISLKQRGVSDDVLLAMVNAPHGASGQTHVEPEGQFEVSVSVASLTPISRKLASSTARRLTKDEVFQELVPLRRVFVASSDPAAGRAVIEILENYSGLEVVKAAKAAEFVLAYSIVANKPKRPQQLRRAQAQMTAYTRTTKGQRRRLWHENAPYGAGASPLSDQRPVALALRFVNELKKARGEME